MLEMKRIVFLSKHKSNFASRRGPKKLQKTGINILLGIFFSTCVCVTVTLGGQDCRNVVTQDQDQDQELRNTSTSRKEDAEKNVDAEYHVRPAQESIKTENRSNQRRVPPKFIKNTIEAIQRTFRSLEMHSKRRYKICICSFVLGQLESFRNYKGLSIIFPKMLDKILRKGEFFGFLSLSQFLIRKILDFLFLRKIASLDF